MTRIFWKKTYQIVDESKSESDVNVVEGHTEGRQHVKQGHLGPHHVDDRKYRNLVNIILKKVWFHWFRKESYVDYLSNNKYIN